MEGLRPRPTRGSPLGSRAPGLQPRGDWLPGHPVSVRTLHGAGEHFWPLCRQGLIRPDPSLTSPGLGQVRVRPSTASATQPGQRCQVGSRIQTPRCHRVGGCEETGGRWWEGKRTGHRPTPNLPHVVTTLGSPSSPETLQDSLLLSCCRLKPARYFVSPSPAPTQSPDLGAPWSRICPYLSSSPGWPLSLSRINLSTCPSGTDPHHECAVTPWEGGPRPAAPQHES